MPTNKSATAGEAIRRLRHFKSFKQSSVAQKMGISQQAYSKLERSKNISPENIAMLLKALGSSMDELEKIKDFYPPPH